MLRNFARICETSTDSMKELIDSVASAEFRLIDYPKEKNFCYPFKLLSQTILKNK